MLKNKKKELTAKYAFKSVWNAVASSLQSSRTAGVLLLMLCATFAFAQPKDNSPYSRLGLGDQVNQQFAASRGFASLSAAYQHSFHINIDNPASLAFLKSTAFEVGLYAKYAQLESSNGEQTDVWSGNVRYFALAFPLQNPINRELERDQRPFHWGMNLALVPFSQVGYNLQIEDINPAVDTTLNIFTGQGGTYRFIWGNGVRYKNLAFGINAGFLFGNILRTAQTSFSDIDVSYDNLLENEYNVSGVIWNFGLQYRYDFKSPDNKGNIAPNGKSFVFGAFGNSANGYTTTADQFYRSINQITTDVDTSRLVVGQKGDGTLPAEFTFGIMYQDANKLRLGAEVSLESWSQYVNPVEPVSLENVYSLAVGGEWTPDAKSYNSYAKRMQYRAGFRLGTDPRGTDGDLKYSSLTLGLGMPIISKGSQSYLDWGLEFGRFGSEDGLNENFIRLTAGFTINDNGWFFKRRYN